ncbi:MAG: hypothetical protein JWQ44_1681, partial [Chthoniobacter sp.]|nr:hypothetical protein [Chthoniobacter sp.]
MKLSRRQFLQAGAGALALGAAGCDQQKAARFFGIGPRKIELTGALTAPTGETLD